MNTTDVTPLARQLAADCATLRRELEAVIREASEAIERMNQGGTPSYLSDGSIVSRTAANVELRAGAIRSIVNLAGSDALPHAEAVAALKGEIR